MNYFDEAAFLKEINKLGFSCDKNTLSKFDKYAQLLCEWNKVMNLTAISDPFGIAIKHFADSLTVFSACNISEDSSVADIGTGAGFPGIPMKIFRPDIKLTLVDSLEKRLKFLETVVKELNLSDVTLVHTRAEEGGRTPKLRDAFDFSTARAVANLPVLCEYCLPYVKEGGKFIAMKSKTASEELTNSTNAIKLLGGGTPETHDYTLDDNNSRCIIVIPKLLPTPDRFPRKTPAISKKSL